MVSTSLSGSIGAYSALAWTAYALWRQSQSQRPPQRVAA